MLDRGRHGVLPCSEQPIADLGLEGGGRPIEHGDCVEERPFRLNIDRLIGQTSLPKSVHLLQGRELMGTLQIAVGTHPLLRLPWTDSRLA